ncbi:vezatin-like [Lineus longissimus]|uniref:vezatin-like n=1 Tax=Lineus longissimus TaxID=88925 RepID=UPI002B4EEEA9
MSDEEVIFENSALFQHLQDVGFSKDDIHAEKIHAKTSADQFVQEVTKPKGEWFSALKNGAISRIVGCYQKAVHEQDAHYKTIVTQTVARSKALVEDDAAFLENFVALPKEGEQPKKKNPHELTLSKVLRVWSHWAIVLAYLVHRLITLQLPNWYVFTDICAGLVMAFYLIPTTVLYLFLWRHNAAWLQMMQQLQMYLILATALSQYMKKSVRFIQEMELINRGFTMVSALSPVTRLEQSSQKGSLRQSPQLRQILFHVSRDIMLIHKRATCILLDVCPLLPEIDNSSNYIANISLDEYGPCLSITLNSKEAEAKLMEATDDYALAALKAMCQLCELQFSEYTRRFALSHVSDLERPNRSNKQNKKLVYVQMLRELISKLQDGVGTLQRLYEFHKCSVLERRRSSAGILPLAKTPQENVHVAVHSLELHLLSLLKRVRDVQDTIQAMEPSEKRNLEVSILSEYQIMKMDLDACRGCWEEGLARLEKMFDVNQHSQTVSNVETPTPSASAADIKPIPLIKLDSPLIQDEVFEAYTDDVDEIQRDFSWDEFLTPEEKAKKKREKEEAKRLLNELRSVINIKAAERERREQVAMERMKGQQEVVKGEEVKVVKGENEAEAEEGDELSLSHDGGVDLDTSVETLKASVETLDGSKGSNEEDMAHGDGLKQGHENSGDLNKSVFAKSKPDMSFPDVLVPGPSKNDTPSSASGSCSWQVLDDTTPSSSASWQVIDEQQSKEGSMVLSDGSNYSLGDVVQGSRRQSSGRISQSISSESPSFELIPKSTMAESESSGSFDILPDSPEDEDSSIKALNPQPLLDPDMDRERIEDKLERVCGANLAFTSNVAAMAVARSQNLGLQQDTFGDDSDDDDDDDENGVTVLEC